MVVTVSLGGDTVEFAGCRTADIASLAGPSGAGVVGAGIGVAPVNTPGPDASTIPQNREGGVDGNAVNADPYALVFIPTFGGLAGAVATHSRNYHAVANQQKARAAAGSGHLSVDWLDRAGAFGVGGVRFASSGGRGIGGDIKRGGDGRIWGECIAETTHGSRRGGAETMNVELWHVEE